MEEQMEEGNLCFIKSWTRFRTWKRRRGRPNVWGKHL